MRVLQVDIDCVGGWGAGSDGINSSGDNIILYTYGKQKTLIFSQMHKRAVQRYKNKNMVVDFLLIFKYLIFVRNETSVLYRRVYKIYMYMGY